jgi:hypothetical protein
VKRLAVRVSQFTDQGDPTPSERAQTGEHCGRINL